VLQNLYTCRQGCIKATSKLNTFLVDESTACSSPLPGTCCCSWTQQPRLQETTHGHSRHLHLECAIQVQGIFSNNGPGTNKTARASTNLSVLATEACSSSCRQHARMPMLSVTRRT